MILMALRGNSIRFRLLSRGKPLPISQVHALAEAVKQDQEASHWLTAGEIVSDFRLPADRHLLRKRAGMTGQRIYPSLLRSTFAVQYLQAGGEPETLRDILSRRGKAALKRYEMLSAKKIANDPQQEPDNQHPSRQQPVPQQSTQSRRRSSSVVPRNHQQPGASKTYRPGKKKPANDAAGDPCV
jgi:hypothetical protein